MLTAFSRTALVVALCVPAVAAQDRPWPFGAKEGRGSASLDLYNLGILGVKVSDADRPPPRESQGGRRTFESGGPAGNDAGPARLRVDILFPKGPAERSGLVAGDIIVGLQKKPFGAAGSLASVADALTKAESGTKNVVVLFVERTGKNGPERVEVSVKIPKGKKELAKPTDAKARNLVAQDARKWLAQKQNGDGGFDETLSGTNGAVCLASLAGLAWLAGGDAKSGPYAQSINKAVKFVLRYALEEDRFAGSTRSNWDQSTWGVAHAAIFLGELYGQTGSPLAKRELGVLAKVLEKRQESSGGYAHGPGGKNALNYLELNILGVLVLNALGLAEQAGHDIDRDVVKKLAQYLEDSASADGGVGYSTGEGQKGHGNIGRTAGAYLGFLNAGLGRHPFASKMKSWLLKNGGDILGGHASLMQHVLLGGLGAEAVGGAAKKAYWDAMGRDLVLARAPDGSLQPRPWHESLLMGSNSDVSFGEVWSTAAWAIVLSAETGKAGSGGLPTWLGRSAKQRQ